MSQAHHQRHMRYMKQLGSFPLPAARDPGDDMPAMICRAAFEELCVLANGDIVCSCADPTGLRVYGNVFIDRIADVFNGPMYREIRQWQLQSKPACWCPAISIDCPARVVRAAATDTLSNRHVKLLQLEPISHCNLACPACPVTTHFPDPELTERAYKTLPLSVMLDVVGQLPHLETLLFYNFGEPFLHKDAISFLKSVKKSRPDIFIATSTNALPLTPAKIEALACEALIDNMVFAIDGIDDHSYARYRVGGDVRRALHNMRAYLQALDQFGTRKRVNATWQYLLFEWNDSEDELARAKAFAAEIGIAVQWTLTHTEGASKRFSIDSPALRELADGMAQMHSCGVQLKEFLANNSVSGGRYLARLSTNESIIIAPAKSELFIEVTAENISSRRWNSEVGAFRLGSLLRTTTGRRLKELDAAMLPPAALEPRTPCKIPLRVVMPDVSGDYQLLVDIVEENVCWFYDRGSPPLICSLIAQ
jgi:pyruvate-formate lyase-activating enzyme